jgi:hypothetical protein
LTFAVAVERQAWSTSWENRPLVPVHNTAIPRRVPALRLRTGLHASSIHSHFSYGIESLILVTVGHHEAVKILCTDDVPYQNLLMSGLSQPPSEELLPLEPPVSPPALDLRTAHTCLRWVGLDSEQGARVEKEAQMPYGRTTRNT